jgi:parallel beta-helix repeat protein
MFREVGADLSLHGDGTYEDPQQRAARIADEVNSGLRTAAQVRQAVVSLVAAQRQSAGRLLSIEAIVERVRGFFSTAGVLVQTSVESEEVRLARIAGQIATGERSLVEVERTVQGIAAGTVGFDPNSPAQFGGAGVNIGPATFGQASEVSVPSASGAADNAPDASAAAAASKSSVASAPTQPKATAPKVTTTTTTKAVVAPKAPAAPRVTTTTAAPKATTTTTKPRVTTTTKAPSAPVSGVVVRVGESIQAAVDAHPAGTTFVIKSGVHKRQSVSPKAGNTFVGESGAVMSGENVTEVAFRGQGADGVTIRGLVIEKYAAPLQVGVVENGSGSHNWTVEGNEVRYNGGIGIRSSTGWRVLNNYVHHNQQLGLSGGGTGALIEGNEIAFNNWEHSVSPHWSGGGTKWVKTRNLVVRNNYSHDNIGPGLWTDGENVNTLYVNNRVVDNYHSGIKHEVSCSAVIRNNTATGNGFGAPSWVDGAGILVMNSPNVEVFGNVVRNNNDGIGGIHATRNVVNGPCERELRNFWVHDNIIEMQVGHTGVVTNFDGSVFTSMNNKFDRNTYILGSGDKYYRWSGPEITTAQWKAAGQDPNSTWN